MARQQPSQPPRDARPGWNLAAVTGGAHLRRLVEMFEEMDFETMLEPVTPEQCEGCTICYRESNEPIYRVYSRPKQADGGQRPPTTP